MGNSPVFLERWHKQILGKGSQRKVITLVKCLRFGALRPDSNILLTSRQLFDLPVPPFSHLCSEDNDINSSCADRFF